ncbi:MAG TPA: hypothetical protein VMT42_04510 [candidate division Zixibacteria bacterium]|nr:hypothetical protein [candidate division Zixibacteria bacterium]
MVGNERSLRKTEAIVGKGNVLVGDEILEEYGHDEAINVKHFLPAVIVKPENSGEVAKILSLANEKKFLLRPEVEGLVCAVVAWQSPKSILLCLDE